MKPKVVRHCSALLPLSHAWRVALQLGESGRLNMSPGAALLVGILAGLIYVFGFVNVTPATPFLARKALSMLV